MIVAMIEGPGLSVPFRVRVRDTVDGALREYTGRHSVDAEPAAGRMIVRLFDIEPGWPSARCVVTIAADVVEGL